MNWPINVTRLATAIRHAEGSKPEWNNPLDLTYAFGYPTVGVANNDGVLMFAYPEDGWNAGCHEVSLMLNGRSHVYSLDDTLWQVGQKYANGDPNWAKNVAAYLGEDVTCTLRKLAG